MDTVEELSRHELLILREIRLNGQASDETTLQQLLDDELIRHSASALELTSKGLRLLVRGSPALWNTAL